MITSQKGLELIKNFEGLVLHAYKDKGSKNGLPISIGYGSTMYEDGTKIRIGDGISRDKAEELLKWEVKNKTSVLRGMNLKLNQNQFDALTSFIYNVGIGAFENSTLLKRIRINENDPDIRKQFGRWIYNDGKVLDDLVRRRKMEADLYFTK